MALRLLVGPANAGKVERLLDGYLAALNRDPVLIVPNRPDVEWAERELLARRRGLIGGWICTFPDLFERIAEAHPARRRVASDVQQSFAIRRAVARTALNGLGDSARSRRSSRACCRRTSFGGRSRASTPRTAASSIASTSGIVSFWAPPPPSGSPATSTRGPGSPCSRTASRI